jgi:hypothetical protein
MNNTFILLITLLILTGFVMKNKQQEYHPSKGEQLVNSTLAKTAKIIKDKYNLKPCGEGASMPGGPIQELTLCFDTKYPHTKEQLRELLIKTAQELLGQVNQNKEIQEFIKEPPFTIKHIQIIIYNSDKNGREIYDPGISTAEISEGILTYQTVDAADTFKYKQEFAETYEEGLKAINK